MSELPPKIRDQWGVLIGTSGWNYDHWKSSFYSGVKRKDWLRHYAEQFNAVEVNATFYRLQKKQTFERWYDETPPDFRFSLKGNRFLTHNKKLNDPLQSVARERECAIGLREKLAVVVWQLPGTFTKHIDRLQPFVEALKQWDDARHAIEFRNSSWFDDEVATCLNEHKVANCRSDAADWPMWDKVTTNLVYVRLHGHTRTYSSSYSSIALIGLSSEIRKWRQQKRTVHVYFDNDAAGAAPADAKRLTRLLHQYPE
jgi:uncharacterized protein YecE (DUF72 family)